MKRRTTQKRAVPARESVKKKNRALAALLEASQALVTSLELSTVLQTIVETATRLLALDTGAIYLVEGEQLFLGATTPPLPADFPEVFRHTPLGEHPHIQRCIRDGDPVVVPDAATEDFSTEERKIVEARGLRSMLYLSITMDRRAIGVLILGTVGRTRKYPADEIDLYRTVSNQAALVIENAHLYKNVRMHAHRLERQIEERKQAERLQRTLYDVARAATTATNLEELSSAIHRILSLAIDAENLSIALYDELNDTITYPYFVDERESPPPPGHSKHGLTEYVLRTGHSLLCDEAMTRELVRNGEAEAASDPPLVWLGVPLTVKGRPIGVLAVRHYSNAQAYGAREQQILEFVSSEVVHALDRQRAAEDIERSLSLLSASLESTADGLLVVDLDGGIVQYNQRFARMWRIPEEVLASRRIEAAQQHILSQLKEPEAFLARIRDLYDHPAAESRDVLEFVDGRTFERISLPQRIGESIVGRVWSYRDITEHRKLQEQFLQSQKMESLGTLASGIAHDFNNILSIIIGHAAELEKMAADPATRLKHAEAITSAGRRGTSLVKQMLTFARKTEAVMRPVSLNELVLEIVKLIHETFPRTITIVTELATNLTSIEADATQIQQVLLNLCVNSRDAMPTGGTISITTLRTPGPALRTQNPLASDGDYVVLRVSDTGVGMNTELRHRIFEPFFTTKEHGRGTGLGLSLVFGIMETHKGFVTVESEPGRGTAFQCCFPVLGSAPQISVIEERRPETEFGGTETVLVVEDEPELRALYAVVLERSGYRVLTASNGEEALRIFLEHRPEIRLVLSDVGLPRMSGDELYRKLRSIDPAVPVILASGYVDPQVKSRLLAEGLQEFIDKPYEPDQILRIVRRVLDGEGHSA